MTADSAAPVTEAALNSAYRERNAVVAALIRSNGWKAEVVMAPDTEGWWIVYAETPQGQVSWHIAPEDMDLFRDWPVAFGSRPSPWDGHTTEEKYRRLAAIEAEAAAAVSAREGLDTAWAEAVAALPEGWRAWGLTVLPDGATAFVHGRDSYRSSDHPTPATALRALARLLSEKPEAGS